MRCPMDKHQTTTTPILTPAQFAFLQQHHEPITRARVHIKRGIADDTIQLLIATDEYIALFDNMEWNGMM